MVGTRSGNKAGLLLDEPDWTFDLLGRAYDEIEKIAIGELGLDVYANQIEVITSEQMLDAYSSIGLPLLYRHWSFGKKFAREETLYRKGMRALAYELVINSDPCICYIMEENSITMQTLVMAHAAFGHNHFFKNNYLFKQWTRADSVLDYLDFAKRYVAKCEERYGVEAVERVLDAAHALMSHGVNRYRVPRPQGHGRLTAPACPGAASVRRVDLQRPVADAAETGVGAARRHRRSVRGARPRPAGGEPPSISSKRPRRSLRTGSGSCCASSAIWPSTSIRSARPG